MLIAPNTPQQATETEPVELQNAAFFPNLTLAEFRTQARVDATASEPRATSCLYSAMLETNQRLASWMQTQQAAGIGALSELPEHPGHPPGARLHLYKQAVFALAKAAILETLHDYDSTNHATSRTAGSGDEPAHLFAASEQRRVAAWAINDIQGLPRVTVELI